MALNQIDTLSKSIKNAAFLLQEAGCILFISLIIHFIPLAGKRRYMKL